MNTSKHHRTWLLTFLKVLLPWGLWILGTSGFAAPWSMERISECKHPGYHPQCQAAQDEISCQTAGGVWEICQGLMCRPGCLCPTPRGGCPCSSGRECEGRLCLAQNGELFPNSPSPIPAGICQVNEPIFGCFPILIEPGEPPVTLCID